MNQWKHSASVVLHIFGNSFPYSKWKLLFDYLRLITSAFFNRATSSQSKIFKTTFLGFSLNFRSWAELINLIEEIFIYQVYRIHLNNQNPVIIDCGSHIGLSVLYFSKLWPQATIRCFEANADNFELLNKNVEENALNSCVLYNAALSNSDGMGSLYHHATESINSSLFTMTNSIFEGVELKKLSSSIEVTVHLLKMDIEGSEKSVIGELIASGKIGQIRNIVMEFHPELVQCKPQEMTDLLSQHGYRCVVEPDILHPGASEVIIRSIRTNS